MIPKAAIVIRITVIAVMATGIAAVLTLFPIPPKIHSLLLGTGAVLFAISEAYFRSLISEMNAAFRRSGYSIWQMEQLQQEIPKLRDRIWALWNLSLWLKAIVGVLAVLLQWPALSLKGEAEVEFVGYALLFITFLLSFWAQKNFRRVEKWCDDIATKEVEIKEQKRLKTEITSGTPHDFKADTNLESYSKPPHSV